MVLNAAAWLSPSSGGSGLSNGKTQGSAGGWPSCRGAVLAPLRGTSTIASCGWALLGSACPFWKVASSGAPPASRRSADAPTGRNPGRDAAGDTRPTCCALGSTAVISPLSSGWIGRYVPGCGHQAQKSIVRTTALSVAAAIRLRTDVRLQRASPRNHRSPMRPMMRKPAITGSTTASTCSTWALASTSPPCRHAAGTPPASCCTTAHAVPSSRGTAVTSASNINAIIGIVTSTHAVITARAHGFRTRLLGMEPPVRQQSEQGGLDPVVQVGDAGQVSEHVIAVEAQQRHQLMHHLHDLGRHQEQQCVPLRGVPPGEGEHHHDGVEVQAAQVGAKASPPSQPVAVGHVGVERGPHQVDAGPDHSWVGSAVARGRRVPELVEAPGEHRHHEHEQQQVRPLEGVVRRRGEALVEEDPPGDRQEAEDHDADQRRPEEEPERVGQSPRRPGVGDGELELQRQQRVGPLERRLGPVVPA